MEKKKYIKPYIAVIGDDDDFVLMAAHSKGYETEDATETVTVDGTYIDNIDMNIEFVTDEMGLTNAPTPNAKTHELWEEW